MQGFKKHYLRLMGLLRRRGRTTADAEDIIQEAFLKLETYCRRQEVKDAEAFLVRTALNISIDSHRKGKRSRLVPEAVEDLVLTDPRPLPDELVSARQRFDRLRAALESLPPRAREALLLHRLDGYSYEQIAAQLGISVSAVEKNIGRAMYQLNEWMDRE
jgi:RNA polymerase sigma factor (sigma-70 family)